MDQPQNSDRPGHVTPAHDPQAPVPPVAPTPASEGPVPAAPPPPLTPMAWLANNAIYFLLMLVVAVWLYRSYGIEGLWKGAVVVLGIGFVIFIHELGHFVVAKLCDVHVTTFSVGFGPALPGCSFQRGETTYKIGVLPLGGYVSMVGGEGMDPDEDENYPRSLRNKPVGQRMLIMSAGVFMNVVFGFCCFIGVYLFHGRDRLSSSIWRVEAGSPAWRAGVQSDWIIEQIGGIDNPSFEQLKTKVALGGEKPILVRFRTLEGKEVERVLVPHRKGQDQVPVIGIAPAPRLKLWGTRGTRDRTVPVVLGSAAAAARPLDLSPGDEVVRATDPEHNDGLTPVNGYDALATRLDKLAGKPLVVEVKRKDGRVEKIDVPVEGFAFGDSIIASTAVDKQTKEYDPFRLAQLPPPPTDVKAPDVGAFELRRRMKQLLGRPVVIEVERRKEKPTDPIVTARLLVPPAYHLTFGLRMKMGPITAIREDSPAAKANLVAGDVIEQVILTHNGKEVAHLGTDKTPLDPLRLRYELEHRVGGSGVGGTGVGGTGVPPVDAKPIDRRGHRSHQWRVTLRVRPLSAKNGNAVEDRGPMQWESSFRFDSAAPVGLTAPLALPELGLAYDVENVVEEVKSGSVAARAELKVNGSKEVAPTGLQKGDEVVRIRFREPGSKVGAEPTWSDPFDVVRSDVHEKNSVHWPSCFWSVQPRDAPGPVYSDLHEVELVVKRSGKVYRTTLLAEPDTSWPLAGHGLLLQMDVRLEKASSPWQALEWGVERTESFIQQIYLVLSRMLTGSVSAKALGGPVEIASQAFSAAESAHEFFLFLGLISVNLAVLNFLPIPLLDGGHMVFLIYEKLRGRPAPEHVRNIAAFVGFALLMMLMAFVFYQDFERRGWLRWLPWQ